MRQFMDYILQSWGDATGWNKSNSYSQLNETAAELLNFPTPRGIRISLSSLAVSRFATSYDLALTGAVEGSIAYLYSSVPLTKTVACSDSVPLPAVLRSYHQLKELPRRAPSTASPTTPSLASFFQPANHKATKKPARSSVDNDGQQQPASPGRAKSSAGCDDRYPTLLFGRLYLPQSMLEALAMQRLTPELSVQLTAVSQEGLPNGGTMLGTVLYDEGRYNIEGIASTDSGLLGLRGLYNFGGDASPLPTSSSPDLDRAENHTISNSVGASVSRGGDHPGSSNSGGSNRERERIYGRFSAGGEIYYGTLNKSGGLSLGARFATLPAHHGTPLTATLTINPLMGSVSATYAVAFSKASCALATKLDFNVYSYESDWVVGMELWNRRPKTSTMMASTDSAGQPASTPVEEAKKGPPPRRKERSFQAKMEWRLDDPEPAPVQDGRNPSDGLEQQAKAPKGRHKKGKDDKKLTAAAAASGADVSTTNADNEDRDMGVLKGRLDQNLKIGVLWEGRVKSLLFSLGTSIDLRKPDQPFRSVGLGIQYSS